MYYDYFLPVLLRYNGHRPHIVDTMVIYPNAHGLTHSQTVEGKS